MDQDAFRALLDVPRAASAVEASRTFGASRRKPSQKETAREMPDAERSTSFKPRVNDKIKKSAPKERSLYAEGYVDRAQARRLGGDATASAAFKVRDASRA